MSRDNWHWWVLGMFAALVLLFVQYDLSVSTIFPKEVKIHCEHYSKAGQKYCSAYELFVPFIEWIVEKHGPVTALATLLIGIFTGTLWNATRKLHQISARQVSHFESAERAFVFLRKYTLTAQLDHAGKIREWQITPVFENSGNTPTRRLVSRINLAISDGEGPEEMNFRDGWKEEEPQEYVTYLIAPKTQSLSLPFQIHIVDIDAVKRGEKRMFIYGWVDYDDVFPGTPRHRTEFCGELTVIGNPAVDDPSWARISTYRKYNGADDECYRGPAPWPFPERERR